MAGELQAVADDFINALDTLDPDRMVRDMDPDAQGVDELSRQWLRGRDELERYIRQITGMVTDVHTTLRDVTEYVWGDTGLLTCWFEQRYTLDGAEQHISAPTTIVFRRTDGQWKLALFHSIPLSDHDVSDPGVTL